MIMGVSLLAGLITGRTFFFNVTYAFTGLLVFAFVWAWSSAHWLRLTRQTRSKRAQVGHYLDERFTVRNTGFLPKLWLEVYDHSTLPGHHASHVVSLLTRNSSVSWPVQTLCVIRGEFTLGPLRVVAGDPFGLFEVERSVGAVSQVVVYPATFPIARFNIPSGILPGGEAVRRRTHQITTNAAGVRDYMPGDSFNRVHWPSTARKDRMIVKEFELDPLADIWMMLDQEQAVHAGGVNVFTLADLAYRGHGIGLPESTEEYGVATAASLAEHFIDRERSVGLATNGRHPERIQVDRGPRQLTKFLESLALTQPGVGMGFDQLLSIEGDQLSRGTTAILITPSTREAWVEAASRLLRRGLRVIAVLIDAESFGGHAGARHVSSRLAALRIPSVIIKQGDDIAGVLSSMRIRDDR
jgi:uncharacterized protein (DUF58 family)